MRGTIDVNQKEDAVLSHFRISGDLTATMVTRESFTTTSLCFWFSYDCMSFEYVSRQEECRGI